MTVKLHVFLDTNTIKKSLNELDVRDVIICGKGMSKYFKKSHRVFELGGVSNERELKMFANSFYKKFTKMFSEKDVSCYSQVNDIFKFILFDLFEITKLIKKIKPTVVFLYEGNSKLDFISIYLAANTEVANPLFSSRARIINPLLVSWLSSVDTIKLNWREENYYKLRFQKLIRNALIFSFSLVTVLRTVRRKKMKKPAENLALYRTQDQYENLLHICDFFPDLQFVRGPAIVKKNEQLDTSLISLKTLGLALYDASIHKLKEPFTKKDWLIVELNGGVFRIEKKSIMNESNCLVTSFAYYRGLRNLLEKNSHIQKIFTSEMSSRYAVIEKVATDSSEASLFGLQFISIGNIILPKFPLQKKILTKSKSDYKILKSLYSSDAVIYVGSFLLTSKLADIENMRIEKSIFFYSQPYGIDDNIRIIKIILKSLPTDWNFYVRNHPRDSYNYNSISELVHIDSKDYYFDGFASTSIVVSKSSSVLVDSIEMGKVTIPVAFDSYTRNILSSVIGNDVQAIFEESELENTLRDSYETNVQFPDLGCITDVLVTREKLDSAMAL